MPLQLNILNLSFVVRMLTVCMIVRPLAPAVVPACPGAVTADPE